MLPITDIVQPWFFLSDILSVWGWNADDRFWLIPKCRARLLPKWNVNRGLQSLMTLFSNLNHLYMWSMYNWMTPGPIIVVVQGRKMAAHKHPWSTMVRIASFPLCLERPVIRSIAICLKGSVPSFVVIQYSGVFVWWVMILFCWHVAQPFTYSAIHLFIPCHC
jgi:hypothetical protein